jgi:hypothetical protein
VEGCLRQH